VLTRVASDGNPHAGVWSPDGERILFSANLSGAGNANIFVQAADGSGEAQWLVTSPQHADPGSWSRDGRWVVYAEFHPVTGADIWKVDTSSGQATPFLQGAGDQTHPAISPDGRWIAYAAGEANHPSQVYVEAFPDGGQRTQLSADGGVEPLWASDGRQLYFRTGNRLMKVSVGPGPRLSAGVPTLLFEAPFRRGMAIGPPGYAVAPAGQHFYFLRDQVRPPEPTRINVVLGWIDELERRLGRSS
jgi:Tol biopolymer transport system component